MDSEFTGIRAAFLGGITATLTLTALMYMAPLAGFPSIDMASSIGGFLDRPATLFTTRWWMGFAVFFVGGAVLSPLLFSCLAQILYGKPWQRGVEWGILLWLFGAVCVMVHLGLAFHPPFTTHPRMSTLSSFLGNVVYGVVLAMGVARHGLKRPSWSTSGVRG